MNGGLHVVSIRAVPRKGGEVSAIRWHGAHSWD